MIERIIEILLIYVFFKAISSEDKKLVLLFLN